MSDLKREIERRRTFAIISLLYGGAIQTAGSVKGKATAKHAVSDWMELEKQRGISITSSVMQFEYEGYCINILDTPGHQDFSEDTYRTLMAADSAVVVIDAAKGIEAHGYICDVTNEEQVNAMVADINKELGVIDILVNNAGIIKRIPMTEMSLEDFRQVVDIDLNAPFIVSKAVIPGMKEKGHGKIINICSMMSELGRETVSAYAAAKGGLKMLTRNICAEFGEYNIQCNGIGPGYIATPQTAPLRERQPDGSRHPFDSFILAKTPAARWGEPEDLMGPVVFLASDASNFVNGHILYVDGGILAYIGKQP